ncbi:MAG: gamma-glutamyltransferase, partial [Gammaproteobacteria bacterium]|nr:gamma-glutamyltransferase [Gammaproteobacteria bacterium]
GRLLSPDYLRGRAATIDMAHAAISAPQADPQGEGADTTHLAVLDGEGNRVAATLSVNYPFGSGYVVPGTGVLLNDEMDDFSAKPGSANVYGLVGNAANAIAPGKRMLSSMSPTFFEHGDEVLVVGTPGGSRIISMVLLAVLDAAEGRPLSELVGRGRFHHQFLPDRIDAEADAIDPTTLAELQRRGHRVRQLDQPYGNMQAVSWNRATGEVSAASDPRGIGESLLFGGETAERRAASAD